MANQTSPLSSMSYIDKDFRDIYPELLDLVKKLTYKWDPSISNESDPGVILLKLNAIIADKNNYNIDKNILEAFPETLTQDVSARSVYKQLGYNMPWYRSAETELSLTWTGDELPVGVQIRVPKYTMVSDSENKFIYTLLNEVVFDKDNTTVPCSIKQGVIETLSINGSNDIHLVNMDDNNRVYFDDNNVAENGVFITNIGSNTEWIKVDNLAVEPYGMPYYEFGVDPRTNRCYVEFPEDIDTLIEDGLTIKYLLSDGYEGNVAARTITNFYEDVSIEVANKKITLNKDNCTIYNPSASVNGVDPQSIEDARRSYKKFAGTFDTLVTVRDYMNAVYRLEYIANDIVSDRNSDVQNTYSIISDNAGFAGKVTEFGGMDAFDLKLYLLNDPGTINYLSEYESTFDMIPTNDERVQRVKIDLDLQKCVAHDFSDIDENIPCLFRIAYPLRLKIVPQYKLTDAQQNDLKGVIIRALYEALNSRKVEFGEEPSYDEIYDVVANSDERIKLAVIDDFSYTTFATYWDGKEFKNIPLTNFEDDPYIRVFETDSTVEEKDVKDSMLAVAKALNNPAVIYYVWQPYVLTGAVKTYDSPKVYRYDSSSKSIVAYSTEVDTFRTQLITKSILAGVTPLYKQDVIFKYTIDQQVKDQPTDVSRLSTYLEISPFGYEDNKATAVKKYKKQDKITSAIYTLKDNESLQFFAPSLVSKRSYSNYVAYQFIKRIPTGKDYKKLSYETYRSIVSTKPSPLYAYTSEAWKYIDITDKITSDAPYITPLYAADVYYSTAGELVTENTEPGDWGTGTYYYDKAMTRQVAFLNNGKTFIQAWNENELGVYYYGNEYVIPANTDYQLQSGDSIVFFYTQEEGNNIPYTYECYKGSDNVDKNPIIRASFTLTGRDFSYDNLLDVNKFNDTGYIPYNNSSDSPYSKVYEMFAMYALSGQQTIDIRDLNKVTIKENDAYYYFITNPDKNTQDDDHYIMELDLSGDYFSYILDTDEYFIYTDRNKTGYEILGQGTSIRIKKFDDEKDDKLRLSVDKVEYNLILNQGLSAFESSLNMVQRAIILTEQQIYNLSSGDKVKIDLTDAYEDNTTYPYFKTTEYTLVDNTKYVISYSTNETTFTELPGININDEDAKWRGKAVFNLNSSYDVSQKIDNSYETNRQAIQRITVGENTYPEEIDNTVLYFLTNVATSRQGGTNVDVSYLNSDGERKALELLIYALNKAFNEAAAGYERKGNTLIHKLEEGTYNVTDVSLQNGYKYILGVKNPSTLATFKITISDKNVTCKLLNSDDEYLGEGTWYYSIEGSDLSNMTLSLSIVGNDAESYLTFEDLLKYEDNTLFEERYGISSDTIWEAIKVYDKGNNFKYNYTVDENTRIDDPLEGKTFFYSQHIFNKYALSEALLKAPVDRTTKNPSIISIINNR